MPMFHTLHLQQPKCGRMDRYRIVVVVVVDYELVIVSVT